MIVHHLVFIIGALCWVVFCVIPWYDRVDKSTKRNIEKSKYQQQFEQSDHDYRGD